MNELLICFAWIWIVVGLLSGTLIGLKFYQAEWLGGYASWRRRMIRLGHIAFLGTSLLCLALVFSASQLGMEAVPPTAGYGMLVGAIAMPTVCMLSAYRQSFRHWFAVPVIGLMTGAIHFAFAAVNAASH